MYELLDDASVVQRVLDHIDAHTTHVGGEVWREPVANYRDEGRLARELAAAFAPAPTPFCPSVALPLPGSYLARDAGGVPLLAARGRDGNVRVFRNACRHRGAQVASGRGECTVFACPYHGWSYGLDGALRHMPHADGFPGLDPATHGLVALDAHEHGGLVYVRQRNDDGTSLPETLAVMPMPMPMLVPPAMALVSMSTQTIAANWKLHAESFLEGYHIYPTHRETFYPVQYDNLNVVEHFGRNTRITFPFRNIERQRALPPAQRQAHGAVTFVYHLFPNVMIATFPRRMLVVVLEPCGARQTQVTTFALAPANVFAAADAGGEREALERATDFVDKGAREDRDVVESIQRGLASDANTTFVFGHFEAGIVHFHRQLDAALAAFAG